MSTPDGKLNPAASAFVPRFFPQQHSQQQAKAPSTTPSTSQATAAPTFSRFAAITESSSFEPSVRNNHSTRTIATTGAPNVPTSVAAPIAPPASRFDLGSSAAQPLPQQAPPPSQQPQSSNVTIDHLQPSAASAKPFFPGQLSQPKPPSKQQRGNEDPFRSQLQTQAVSRSQPVHPTPYDVDFQQVYPCTKPHQYTISQIFAARDDCPPSQHQFTVAELVEESPAHLELLQQFPPFSLYIQQHVTRSSRTQYNPGNRNGHADADFRRNNGNGGGGRGDHRSGGGSQRHGGGGGSSSDSLSQSELVRRRRERYARIAAEIRAKELGQRSGESSEQAHSRTIQEMQNAALLALKTAAPVKFDFNANASNSTILTGSSSNSGNAPARGNAKRSNKVMIQHVTDDEKLSRHIQHVTNKLTDSNYQSLSVDLRLLLSQIKNVEMLRKIAVVFFHAAIRSSYFSALYARLIHFLVTPIDQYVSARKKALPSLGKQQQISAQHKLQQWQHLPDLPTFASTSSVASNPASRRVDETLLTQLLRLSYKQLAGEAGPGVLQYTNDPNLTREENLQLRTIWRKKTVFGVITFIGELYRRALVPHSIILLCANMLLDSVPLQVGDNIYHCAIEADVEMCAGLLEKVGKMLDFVVSNMLQHQQELHKVQKLANHNLKKQHKQQQQDLPPSTPGINRQAVRSMTRDSLALHDGADITQSLVEPTNSSQPGSGSSNISIATMTNSLALSPPVSYQKHLELNIRDLEPTFSPLVIALSPLQQFQDLPPLPPLDANASSIPTLAASSLTTNTSASMSLFGSDGSSAGSSNHNNHTHSLLRNNDSVISPVALGTPTRGIGAKSAISQLLQPSATLPTTSSLVTSMQSTNNALVPETSFVVPITPTKPEQNPETSTATTAAIHDSSSQQVDYTQLYPSFSPLLRAYEHKQEVSNVPQFSLNPADPLVVPLDDTTSAAVTPATLASSASAQTSNETQFTVENQLFSAPLRGMFLLSPTLSPADSSHTLPPLPSLGGQLASSPRAHLQSSVSLVASASVVPAPTPSLPMMPTALPLSTPLPIAPVAPVTTASHSVVALLQNSTVSPRSPEAFRDAVTTLYTRLEELYNHHLTYHRQQERQGGQNNSTQQPPHLNKSLSSASSSSSSSAAHNPSKLLPGHILSKRVLFKIDELLLLRKNDWTDPLKTSQKLAQAQKRIDATKRLAHQTIGRDGVVVEQVPPSPQQLLFLSFPLHASPFVPPDATPTSSSDYLPMHCRFFMALYATNPAMLTFKQEMQSTIQVSDDTPDPYEAATCFGEMLLACPFLPFLHDVRTGSNSGAGAGPGTDAGNADSSAASASQSVHYCLRGTTPSANSNNNSDQNDQNELVLSSMEQPVSDASDEWDVLGQMLQNQPNTSHHTQSMCFYNALNLRAALPIRSVDAKQNVSAGKGSNKSQQQPNAATSSSGKQVIHCQSATINNDLFSCIIAWYKNQVLELCALSIQWLLLNYATTAVKQQRCQQMILWLLEHLSNPEQIDLMFEVINTNLLYVPDPSTQRKNVFGNNTSSGGSGDAAAQQQPSKPSSASLPPYNPLFTEFTCDEQIRQLFLFNARDMRNLFTRIGCSYSDIHEDSPKSKEVIYNIIAQAQKRLPHLFTTSTGQSVNVFFDHLLVYAQPESKTLETVSLRSSLKLLPNLDSLQHHAKHPDNVLVQHQNALVEAITIFQRQHINQFNSAWTTIAAAVTPKLLCNPHTQVPVQQGKRNHRVKLASNMLSLPELTRILPALQEIMLIPRCFPGAMTICTSSPRVFISQIHLRFESLPIDALTTLPTSASDKETQQLMPTPTPEVQHALESFFIMYRDISSISGKTIS